MAPWEWNTYGWFQPVPQTRGAVRGLRSRRRVRDPRDSTGQAPGPDRGLRRQDHRRCGNTHRSNESADAVPWEGTTTRRGNSRSATQPAVCSSCALLRESARSQGCDNSPGAQPNHGQSDRSDRGSRLLEVAWPRSSVSSRNNRRLDFAAAVHQFLEDAIQFIEMRMPGDERGRLKASARDQVQSFAADRRRVMKGCAHRDIAIVNAISIEIG